MRPASPATGAVVAYHAGDEQTVVAVGLDLGAALAQESGEDLGCGADDLHVTLELRRMTSSTEPWTISRPLADHDQGGRR